MSDELEKLLDKVHNGIDTLNFDGKEIPCIILENRKYDEIFSKVAGQAFSVNTDLNILQDGLGHVFVDIVLSFSKGNIVEKFLLYANNDLKFFELLACTSLLALSSPKSKYGKDNLFVVQLPKPQKAKDALEIIKTGLASQNNAVTGI